MKPPPVPRKGGWIQTHVGRFWPLDPMVEDVRIEDVACALGNLCRFAGHGRFYSVAQHSTFVSRLVGDHLRAADHPLATVNAGALAGLLHDAAEAYLVDLPSPAKAGLPDYRAAEERVMDCVRKRFGLTREWDDLVAYCDRVALATEFRDVMPPCEWERDLEAPSTKVIRPWSPGQATAEFLARFDQLTEE